MVHDVVLTVALKVADNEARSALEAMRVKMGLAQVVSGLSRETRWELGVESDSPEAAREVVRGLVETTNLFANPNKHRYTLVGEDDDLGASDLLVDEVAIHVTDRDNAEGEVMVSAISRAGEDRIVSARRRVRWRIRLAEAPSRGDDDLLALLRRIAVTANRADGLLSNPHVQKATAILPWGEQKPLDA